MYLLTSTYFKMEDPVELACLLLVLLYLSGLFTWDIYKEKKKSLDHQLNGDYIAETEYIKEIRKLRIYCTLGFIICPILLLLILFIFGFILMLIVFLVSIVFKRSKS